MLTRCSQHRHGCGKVVLLELPLLVDNEVDAIASGWEHVVLQRSGPVIGVNDVTRLLVQVAHPLGELAGIRNGGREEDVAHIVRQQDERLLPDDTALLVTHVVNLIEDHPAHLAHDLAAAVQHVPQDLGGHDQARGRGIDGHIARDQTDVLELVGELAELLVGQSLDGRSVDDALLGGQRLGDGVLGHHSLARRRVGGDQDALAVVDAQDRLALEGIEHKGVFLGRHSAERLQGYVLLVGMDGHLMGARLGRLQQVGHNARTQGIQGSRVLQIRLGLWVLIVLVLLCFLLHCLAVVALVILLQPLRGLLLFDLSLAIRFWGFRLMFFHRLAFACLLHVFGVATLLRWFRLLAKRRWRSLQALRRHLVEAVEQLVYVHALICAYSFIFINYFNARRKTCEPPIAR